MPHFGLLGDVFALGFSATAGSLPFLLMLPPSLALGSRGFSRSFLGWKGIGGGGSACTQSATLGPPGSLLWIAMTVADSCRMLTLCRFSGFQKSMACHVMHAGFERLTCNNRFCIHGSPPKPYIGSAKLARRAVQASLRMHTFFLFLQSSFRMCIG